MSDRLKQLQHQRTLLQQQLAWIDQEIQVETNAPSAASASVTAHLAPLGTNAPRAPVAATPDEILAQYRTDTAAVKSDVKRGCFLYFFLAFALVGLGVITLYLHSRRQ